MTTRKKLDRTRPFGTIYGAADGGVYYQDGVHFGTDDYEVGDEGEDIVAQPEVGAVDVAPEEVDFAPEAESVSRADLEALHISQIKKLVAEAGLELEIGPGSKAKNIDNLLAAG